MSKIAVVYWSGTGNTEAMANLVAEGATSAGAETEVIPCADFSADKVATYDAFAFGCPAMGSEELEYDEFQPMWDEVKDASATRRSSFLAPTRGLRANGWTTGRQTPTRRVSMSSIPPSATILPTMRLRLLVAPLVPSWPSNATAR